VTTNPNDFDYGTTTAPEGALFVAADEPLLVFPSIAAAEQYLEAIDVDNGVYPVAYGPNGEPYRIGSEGRRVFVERTGEPDQPDELKALLLQYLDGSGRSADASASLDSLVTEVWTIERLFGWSTTPTASGSGLAFQSGAVSPSSLGWRWFSTWYSAKRGMSAFHP
jgi:hypothetical protein